MDTWREKISSVYMTRRVLIGVSEWRVRGRLRLGWMNGAKVALGSRGITVEAVRQCAKDRKELRGLMQLLMNEFHAMILDRLPCSLDRPPALWWLIT